MALDLVSILLSQRAPASAAQTMSPIIKQLLPTPGSITAEVLTQPKKSEVETKQTDLVSMGWRMQSLNQAADSLLDSATRLEKEIAKETSYWDQVLKVKEKGWSLSRLPREQHTLGVHFGFAEANPKFHGRGQGALRLSDAGSVYLDSGVNSKKRLLLRLIQDGSVVSTFSNHHNAFEEGSIEQEILSARDGIFDEELFYELNREARFLTNQSVQSRDDSITIPYIPGSQIEIALMPASEIPTSSPFEAENGFLKSLLLTLRLLLAQAHERTHTSRTTIPKPLSNSTRPDPPYPILKTIIEVFAHRSAIKFLKSHMTTLESILKAAGLEVGLKQSSPTFEVSPGERARTLASLTENLTTTTMTLSLQGSDIVVYTNTTLLPPAFGTGYRVTSAVSTTSDGTNPDSDAMNEETTESDGDKTAHELQNQESRIFHTFPDLASEVFYRVQDILKSYIISSVSGWQDAERGVQWLVRGGKDAIRIEVGENARTLRLAWRGITAQRGQQEWVWSGSDGGEERSLQDVLGAI